MRLSKLAVLCMFISVLMWGCSQETENQPDELIAASPNGNGTIVQHADLFTFQPAGDFGGAGNVLPVGTFYPPGSNNHATLKRKKNSLHFNIHTTGLPQGAYTVWWVIFNDTDDCINANPGGGDCAGGDGTDLFNPTATVLWATGGIVQANGVGNFSDKLYVGEQRSETILQGSDLSSPLQSPKQAEVHLVIKYHGLASGDPDILYDQTHTFQGNCGPNSGANSYDLALAPPPFGPYQCFDPQAVIFPEP